jgi:two-component sensor histidine kinase
MNPDFRKIHEFYYFCPEMREFKLFLLIILTFICSVAVSQDKHALDSLFGLIKKEKSEKKLALYYSQIAEVYYFNFPDSAIKYCKIGMSFSEKNNDISDLSYYHNFLGVLYKNINVYDSAVYHFEKAIPLYYQDDFERGAASAKNNLGKVQKLIGDYDKALDNYYSSLEIFEKYQDTLSMGEVHSNIGALLLEINEFDAAEEHFLISQKQYKLAKAELQEAWILYDLGNLKLKVKDAPAAKYYFNSSAKIWKSFDRVKDYNNCMLRLAEAEMLTGNYSRAETLLDEAEKEFYKINHLQGVSESLMLHGRAEYYLKNYKSAIDFLLRSMEISDFVKSGQLRLDIYRDLYKSYKALGEFKTAVDYQDKYISLNDSIFSENRQKMMIEYQTKLNLANKEYFIKQLEDSAAQQKIINENISLKSEQKQNSIYLLIFVICLITVFIYLIFRRYKKTNELNEKLNEALKEREVLIREVHHRVKNNLQIISSLLNLQSEKTEGQSVEEILRVSQARIEAMSMIHENLYKSSKLSEISFKEYVETLCSYIASSFSIASRNISFDIKISPVNLQIDQLVPCGLIINEIVTNCIKHAFDGRTDNIISIECSSTLINRVELVQISISDNGKGLPESFDVKRSKSLGLRLSIGLARQLQSELVFKNENGLKAEFKFINQSK